MLLAALLLFTPNCTFHKFLNVWGTGMKFCAFWCLFAVLSLSLSRSLPVGSKGRQVTEEALMPSEGEKEKVFTTLGGNDGKNKANKTNFHAKFFCSFHRCRTAGAIGEAWVWQQGEFGPATRYVFLAWATYPQDFWTNFGSQADKNQELFITLTAGLHQRSWGWNLIP